MLSQKIDIGVALFLSGTAVLLLLTAAIITFVFLHQKKIVQLKIRLHDEELRKRQAIFDALQEGQEKERTRLSQELHDGVGAKLSGLKMTLEYLKTHTTENAALVAKVFEDVSETLEEVREISHNLHPYYFNSSIEQLLQDRVERLNTYSSCRYSLTVNTGEEPLDPGLKLHLYKIIGELLTNIQKHACAERASVQINREADRIEAVVEDDGIGLHNTHNNTEGIGLQHIQNRIDICKGSLNIDASGKGTTVIITIPLNTNT